MNKSLQKFVAVAISAGVVLSTIAYFLLLLWYKVSLDNTVVVLKNNKHKHLAVLKDDQEFVSQNGVIKFNDIRELPSTVTSSKNHEYYVYIPTFDEFILLMKRGPQIIYPKDIGAILIAGNISKNSNILEIGTGSGALTLYLNLILDKKSQLFTLDENEKNQRRAQKTIERFVASSKINNLVDVNYINRKLSDFAFSDLADKVDTIITDIPEPWEFFLKNQIKQNLNWVSYLPSISQVEKIVTKLRENNFVNLKITETLNREWIVDKKIVRPKNEMVGHTGFVVGARYLSS